MDPAEEIRRLYFNATRTTIRRDLARAIALCKALPNEDARQDVAVFMDGLSQMRAEWGGQGKGHRAKGKGNGKTRRSQ